MTPERKAEIRRFAENGYGIPMRMLDELLAALAAAEQERDELAERVEELHGIVFAFMTRAAEAEQERDDLAEAVTAMCARMNRHMDESQQRHPTWRGVKSL